MNDRRQREYLSTHVEEVNPMPALRQRKQWSTAPSSPNKPCSLTQRYLHITVSVEREATREHRQRSAHATSFTLRGFARSASESSAADQLVYHIQKTIPVQCIIAVLGACLEF